uniref:Uncharacterized protein n=1 Tax=Arundo donax TaxID=35708 RepID=A0A0A9C5F0_ARUDO
MACIDLVLPVVAAFRSCGFIIGAADELLLVVLSRIDGVSPVLASSNGCLLSSCAPPDELVVAIPAVITSGVTECCTLGSCRVIFCVDLASPVVGASGGSPVEPLPVFPNGI